MATATVSEDSSTTSRNIAKAIRVALPYLVAIVAMLPMYCLFLRQMIGKTHYQLIGLAIIATVVFVVIRWPYEEKVPFRESILSNVLLVVGLVFGVASALFVDTWFCAVSVMFLLTSLLMKVIDPETRGSLWSAVLPMFVFLPLPMQRDTMLITTLQRYSAWFTSRILDLPPGIAHFLDGTAILVPGKPGYGVAAACSGVQSFFTLLFITMVILVAYRRINSTVAGGVLFSIVGLLFIIPGFFLGSSLLFYIGLPFIFWGLLGIRAMLLIFAAVFWTMFINVLRIMLIPILDSMEIMDLSKGIPHILLGWGALLIGVLLLLSTDQLILFMFGPVDSEVSNPLPMGKLITRFWNQLLGQKDEETKSSRKKAIPVSNASNLLSWVAAGILALGGLLQLYDVAQAYMQPNLKVKFFDADITQPMVAEDLPEQLENWRLLEKPNGYSNERRDRGSDLGRWTDRWQYRAPRCNAVVSFDQTFPGWHELTTCYRNSGWKLVENSRAVIKTKKEGDPEDQEDWKYVEARFVRDTGERGYLLFSLFDGAGQPMVPPFQADGLESLIERAKNRLTNRVRRSLFSSEAYQCQTFIQHYGELGEETEAEINSRYKDVRNRLRQKFLERKGVQTVGTPAQTTGTPAKQ